jgi:hypothetical protein
MGILGREHRQQEHDKGSKTCPRSLQVSLLFP